MQISGGIAKTLLRTNSSNDTYMRAKNSECSIKSLHDSLLTRMIYLSPC